MEHVVGDFPTRIRRLGYSWKTDFRNVRENDRDPISVSKSQVTSSERSLTPVPVRCRTKTEGKGRGVELGRLSLLHDLTHVKNLGGPKTFGCMKVSTTKVTDPMVMKRNRDSFRDEEGLTSLVTPNTCR